MKGSCTKITLLSIAVLFIGLLSNCSSAPKKPESSLVQADERFITREVDLRKEEVQLFWKDDKGEILKNFTHLKTFVESKRSNLLFAMNAGMFKKDFSPQGLFIQQQKTVAPMDTSSGDGNFYLKPNGVFYISTNNMGDVVKTTDFVDDGNIKYATQSGPMLVMDGAIHPAFKKGSTNLNIRNGVGILPDKKVVFVMSKVEVNLFDFATYFQGLGCKNALYLDGFVSRTYWPEKNLTDMDGNFGVMIGIVKQSPKKETRQQIFDNELLNRCDGKNICTGTVLTRNMGDKVELMFYMDGRLGELTVFENDEKGKMVSTRKLMDGVSYETLNATDFADGKYLCVLRRDQQISKVGFTLVTN